MNRSRPQGADDRRINDIEQLDVESTQCDRAVARNLYRSLRILGNEQETASLLYRDAPCLYAEAAGEVLELLRFCLEPVTK